MERQNLKGKTLEELKRFVESLGEKKYRANQVFSWLYGKRASTFDEMSDIAKEFREVLKSAASLDGIDVVTVNKSFSDETTKFLFRLSDGLVVESVLIPPEPTSPAPDRRLTLCLSTQVGCPLDCRFCATGSMGFSRNLTVGEIVDQVIKAQNYSPRRITNLVYMGMGEPMLNYDNVMNSLEILTDDRSFNIGARHITVSTAGYGDKIRQMADENRKIKLALSLHTLDNEKRIQLMPVTKKYSVDELLDSLEYYYRKTRQRPTVEYILFAGFNDSERDVNRLIQMSKRIPCKINLIPFHSIDFVQPHGFAATLKPASRKRMEGFAKLLRHANVTVMIRSSAGEDIKAACGQLAVEGKKLEQVDSHQIARHSPAFSV